MAEMSRSEVKSGSRVCAFTRLRVQKICRSDSKHGNPITRQRDNRIAFTLVELLVVIAILGILMSLITAGAQAARRRGSITKAKTTIAALETAIAMYSGDLGQYPASGNAALVSALADDAEDPDWLGPYMDFKENELEQEQLIDSWGTPYVYVSVNGGSPKHRERSFDLYSFGPNTADDNGTGDDIVNW